MTAGGRDHGFPRQLRLRSSKDYRRLGRSGQSSRGAGFILLMQQRIGDAWAPAPPNGASRPSRLGITASRRVGNAVVRNRVKRQVREWFRTGRPAATRGFDIVVIARKGVEQWPAARIRAELDRLVAMGVAGYGDAKC